MTSLVYHASQRDGLLVDINASLKERVTHTVTTMLRAAKWHVPSDFMTYPHFLRVVFNVDMTSSPGYPYMKVASNNAQFFNYVDGQFDSDRLQQIWIMIQNQINEKVSDPIRLFIKPEPHSIKKMETGRYRLISSVSIIDQIIDAMLHGELNQELIDNWIYTPVRVGWSPLNGGWRRMPFVPKQMAIDKSSWDWTAQPWLFEVALEVRKRLCYNLTTKWADLADWRCQQLFGNPRFITSGGLLLRQLQPGVMKSGCYNTLMDNSIMQLILHAAVCHTLSIPIGGIIAMGDDTLQDDLPEPLRSQYMAELSMYCNIKVCKTATEFCGFTFHVSGEIEPNYRGKHAYKMLYMSDKIADSMAESYTLMYHRSRFSSLIDNFFRKMGLQFKTRAQRDLLYD